MMSSLPHEHAAREMTQTPQPIVCIVDDDESVRTSMSLLFETVGVPSRSFPSVPAFQQWAEAGFFGCIVLDVRLPGPSGLDLQSSLAAAGGHTPIIFVTAYADVALTVRAMKAGAQEVLTKPYDQQVLLDAVHRALETACERREQRERLSHLQATFETLTPREREVLVLVASGLTNKQIAASHGTTEKTIKVHRASVMRKMRAGSVAALVRMVDRLAIAT
jgi:RNA polymerase sigma factor (sigma-70 family)